MALQTIKTLVALGYQISTDEKDSPEVLYLELPPEQYQLSNGYVPRPLDLEAIEIPECLVDLIDKLSENAHNIWAAERIKQNWTYGKANVCKRACQLQQKKNTQKENMLRTKGGILKCSPCIEGDNIKIVFFRILYKVEMFFFFFFFSLSFQDSETKRNPLLIPYSKLDEAAKKSNYDTAYESVRTICALGCTLDPPTDRKGVSSILQLAREFNANSHIKTRTFRGQFCYKLKEGKW